MKQPLPVHKQALPVPRDAVVHHWLSCWSILHATEEKTKTGLQRSQKHAEVLDLVHNFSGTRGLRRDSRRSLGVLILRVAQG